MTPDETDLPLKRGRRVLVGGQPLPVRLLELRHQLVAAVHERVHEVLAINRFEMTPICQRKNRIDVLKQNLRRE